LDEWAGLIIDSILLIDSEYTMKKGRGEGMGVGLVEFRIFLDSVLVGWLLGVVFCA